MTQWPIFSLGFRPFFILGSVWACIIVLCWSLNLSGIAFSGFVLTDHIYEMVYGFSGAIVVGFLLTATQNWTKKRGVYGLPLIVLCALWTIARVFAIFQINFYKFVFDFLFYAYFIYLIAPYLVQTSQKRNWIIFAILILFLCNITLPLLGMNIHQSLYLSFVGLLLLVFIISHRVIPFFTQNALVVDSLKVPVVVEKLSFLLFFAWLILLFMPGKINLNSSFLAAFCLLLIGCRIKKWPWSKVLDVPILAVLYMSYFWLLVALILDAVSLIPTLNLPRTVVTHALSFGYLGGMILAMISRVSLGHTGRKLEASTAMTISYFIFHVGAFIRVFGPITNIDKTLIYTLSGMFWSLSFIIFIFEYVPYLVTPRVDGKAS